MSRPAVHPVESPRMTEAEPPQIFRMKDVQGMPGTTGGLFLRFCQFVSAAASLCIMVTTSDFPSVIAFRYFVAAVALQSLWSLSLALADVYALLVRRSFRNVGVVSFFAIGDWVSSTLTFAAACSAAGITFLIRDDFGKCNVNHCNRFMSAALMAILSWLVVSPSFMLSFWTLASR